MQTLPWLLLDGWSDRIKLYPEISKLPSSGAIRVKVCRTYKIQYKL